MRSPDNNDRRFQGGSGVEFDRILADARTATAVSSNRVGLFSYRVPSAAHFYDWETPDFIMQSYLPKFMCRIPIAVRIARSICHRRAFLDRSKLPLFCQIKTGLGGALPEKYCTFPPRPSMRLDRPLYWQGLKNRPIKLGRIGRAFLTLAAAKRRPFGKE